MLVKAKTFNERNEVVEQFSFTELQIGGRIDREKVKSRFAGKGRDWRVEQSAVVEADLASLGWVLTSLPPGYRKVTELRRRVGASPDVGQIVVSTAWRPFRCSSSPRRAGSRSGLARHGPECLRAEAREPLSPCRGGPAEGVRQIADSVEYRRP
jgi:negative regulator of sigma E activity